MGDIIGIGGLVYDFISQVDKLPSLGETTLAKDLKFNMGGKSANSVVQASLLGNVSTAAVGKLGNDQFGREQLEDLKSYGVNTDHVYVTDKAPTSCAFVTIDSIGSNHIVLALGADKLLSVADIKECHDIISKSKVVICNLEIPMDSCFEALAIARQAGVTTILVPAPVPENLTADSLPKVDIMCPNQIEAGQLLGIEIETMESAKKAIEIFLEQGKIRWPVITLGSLGAVVGVAPGVVKEVHAPTVDSVDTTGAGDSFVGALAFYLVNDPSLSIDAMVSRAVYIASMSTTKKGTRPSYISAADLP